MKRWQHCGFRGLLGLGCLLAGGSVASAQVIPWSNLNGGNFTTGSNWTGGLVPNPAQTAGFTNSSATVVTFATSVTTGGLFIDNNTDVDFALGGNLYTVSIMSIQDNSLLELHHGTLYAQDTTQIGVTNIGDLAINQGGNVVVAGPLTVGVAAGSRGTIFVNSGGTFTSTNSAVFAANATAISTLNISGSDAVANFTNGSVDFGRFGSHQISMSGNSVLNTSGSANFAVNTGSFSTFFMNSSGGSPTWNHSNGPITTGSGNASFNMNGGTINLSGTGASLTINNGDSFNLFGATLHVTGANLDNRVNIENGGVFSVNSNLHITSTGALAGLRVASGGTLTLQSFGSITTTNFAREGTFNFNGGSFTVDGGVFNNNSTAFNIGTLGDSTFIMANGATTTGVTSVSVGNTAASNVRQFHLLSGSTLTTSATSFIGSTGGGLMRVSGLGSSWNASNFITIGDGSSLGNGTLLVETGGNVTTNGNVLQTGTANGSTGTLTIQNGGSVSAGNINLGVTAGSINNASVTGTGSTLNATNLFIGGTSASDGGTATLTLGPGSTTSVSTLTRIRAAGTLNIAGGTLNTFNLTRTGGFNFSDGTLHLTGGTFSNNSTTLDIIGTSTGQNPTLILDGNTSTSGITNLNIGSNAQEGTVTINSGSTLSTGAVSLAQRGTLNLNGGTLSMASFSRTGNFNWNSGTMRFNSGASLSDSTLTAMLGTNHSLGNSRTISSLGTLTLAGNLALDGGAITGATTLNNDATMTLNQGSVNAATFNNNAGRLIQVNGTTSINASTAFNNSGTLRLTNETTSISGGQLTNNATGTISGTGRINNDLDNLGTIRVTGSEHLVFAGANNRNILNMNLAGGTLEFTQSLLNREGAAITGRGTFVGSSASPGGLGLTNDGLMSFSAGFTDVYGDVNQTSSGRIVTGGGGITTFYDDVVHNGLEIRTFAGSRTVFFGDQSGASPFTGTGVVEYAGDLRPGNSPANVTYEGDVAFNSSAGLFMELGGTTPGSQHDRLTITGSVTVDGFLNIARINGFTPAPGAQFILINNLGTDPIIGNFTGLPEGALIASEGLLYQLSYQGGTGNDLLLTAVPEPTTWALLILGATGAGYWYHRRRNHLHRAWEKQVL